MAIITRIDEKQRFLVNETAFRTPAGGSKDTALAATTGAVPLNPYDNLPDPLVDVGLTPSRVLHGGLLPRGLYLSAYHGQDTTWTMDFCDGRVLAYIGDVDDTTGSPNLHDITFSGSVRSFTFHAEQSADQNSVDYFGCVLRTAIIDIPVDGKATQELHVVSAKEVSGNNLADVSQDAAKPYLGSELDISLTYNGSAIDSGAYYRRCRIYLNRDLAALGPYINDPYLAGWLCKAIKPRIILTVDPTVADWESIARLPPENYAGDINLTVTLTRSASDYFTISFEKLMISRLSVSAGVVSVDQGHRQYNVELRPAGRGGTAPSISTFRFADSITSYPGGT